MPKAKGKSKAQRRKEHRERMRLIQQQKQNEIKYLGLEVKIPQQHESRINPCLGVINGSISQADAKFKHSGLQCTGICLEALRFTLHKEI